MEVEKQLNRQAAIARHLTDDQSFDRPIKVIQFGEGNFLRAFVDWIVQKMNENGIFDGNVAIVQPIAHGRIRELEAQDRLYTVILEGLQDGKEVRGKDVVDSIGKTVSVYDNWLDFLALANNPDTKIIISNTTEAGIALDDRDTVDMTPPNSYPAKLAHLLKRRYDSGLPGFLIVPCELIEDNGKSLHDAVMETAHRFGWEGDFTEWLERENTFVSTLVDRIVPGFPQKDAEKIWEELGYRDDNMVKAEPFLLWVIAGNEQALRLVRTLIPADKLGIDIITTSDIRPYRDRKVYLLNGPHTTMAQIARLAGFRTVGAVMRDTTMRSFIDKEMHEEIIPVLTLPEDELNVFADKVVERFENPFIEHSLDSIALNSVSKFTARLLPIIERTADANRSLPRRIVLALAGLLYIYAGEAPETITVTDADDVIAAFRRASVRSDYVSVILAQAELWGTDLTRIEGLVKAVDVDLHAIRQGEINQRIAELA